MMDWLLEFFGTRPVEEEGRSEEIYTRDFESGAFTTLWCPNNDCSFSFSVSLKAGSLLVEDIITSWEQLQGKKDI